MAADQNAGQRLVRFFDELASRGLPTLRELEDNFERVCRDLGGGR